MANPPIVTFGRATGGSPRVVVLNHRLASINGFFIDCLVSDGHTFDADVTEFPVESGATISDNIRNKPLVVTMECIVSNAPIGQLATLRDQDNDPVDSAYEMLLKVRADRQPVTIFTSLRTYTNMALQNLSIPRESGTGDALKFTVTFKQIELVVNRREKRVAIVGAKNGGSTTRTVQTWGSKSIYINSPNSSWYDFAIDAWRSTVKYGSEPKHKEGTAAPHVGPVPDLTSASHMIGPGQWLVSKGKPLEYTQAFWGSRSSAQRLDAAVRAELLSRGPRPNPFDKKTMRTIRLVQPGQYLIEHSVSTGIGDSAIGPASGDTFD